MAERMAKMGVNLVRLHFLDNDWGESLFDPQADNTQVFLPDVPRQDGLPDRGLQEARHLRVSRLVGGPQVPQGRPGAGFQRAGGRRQDRHPFLPPGHRAQQEVRRNAADPRESLHGPGPEGRPRLRGQRDRERVLHLQRFLGAEVPPALLGRPSGPVQGLGRQGRDHALQVRLGRRAPPSHAEPRKRDAEPALSLAKRW